MRRLVASLLGLAVALAAAGSGPGAVIRGTPRNDVLRGTVGPDLILGGAGRDLVRAGPGADRVAVQADAVRDSVVCGPGRDIVNAERSDTVARDCEIVSRQLTRAGFRAAGDESGAEVEPDSFAAGRTLVAAYQVGRFEDGGAAAIGFATTRDAGRSWTFGLLPRVAAPGERGAVTDPVVAYDELHRTWLVTSLRVTRGLDELLVSRSPDGRTWNAPVAAAASPGEAFDKEWIVCDNWDESPFRGRCYLSYLDLVSERIATRWSADGGATWSAPAVGPPSPARGWQVNGAQPVVRPDGTLVVVYVAFSNVHAERIVAVPSADGGQTFDLPTVVASMGEAEIRGLRASPLPSVDVDRAGRIYAAWHDCQFRPECSANDIVLTTSRDGTAWSDPRRVPAGPPTFAGFDHFIPGLAVDPATSGAQARVAIVYHSLATCGVVTCPGIDVSLITSPDGGATWTAPQRLTAQPMQLSWLAPTGIGRMLGDYISTSYVGGRPIPVYALASEPSRTTLRQSIFALLRR